MDGENVNDYQNASGKKSLSQIVIEAGFITAEQLDTALELQQLNGTPLDQALIEQGLLSPEDLSVAQSIRLQIPLIDLDRHKIPPEVLLLVPYDIAWRYSVLPLSVIGDTLVVVMSNPENKQAINELAQRICMPVEVAMGHPDQVRKAIALHYEAKVEQPGKLISPEVTNNLELILSKLRPETLNDMTLMADAVANAPVVLALELIITQAVKSRASDIHIEPQRDKLRIRYRIDGVLYDAGFLSLGTAQWLLTRVKVLAEMDIAERRRSQDGQFSVQVDGKEVDIRVATFNTIYGETAVLRILEKSATPFQLPELGMSAELVDRYQRMLRSQFGMIVVSGPTGAGKTTTLYASINQLNKVERNIVTVEDPVEYTIDGIKPSDINPKADITFATGLRSILRIDPDVILIGEIRDKETAQIAVQAALTGHLVLSSIHANDAVGVIPRLVHLGVEPFLLSSALLCAIAQRMVRRVCPHCSMLRKPEAEEKAAYEEEMQEIASHFLYGAGCELCAQTGYLGRTCLFELMTITGEIRRLILSGATSDEIHAQAIEEGMMTMGQDGMLKVKQGITTPYEVLRTVYSIR